VRRRCVRVSQSDDQAGPVTVTIRTSRSPTPALIACSSARDIGLGAAYGHQDPAGEETAGRWELFLAGLTFHELLLAGLNSAAPAVVLLGIGVFTLGFAPRLTTIAGWGILAWAFLLDMLGSAIKVNHWVMDTSLLQHVALAPAVNPNWRIVGTYLAIGCAAAQLGTWCFTQRDLQTS
jgi:hypothetical protein